jgi:hypothetical protein
MTERGKIGITLLILLMIGLVWGSYRVGQGMWIIDALA